MDPAGPLFSFDEPKQRLDTTDAQSTIVLHTSSGLGFESPLGVVDFYPNGGKSQPGCGISLMDLVHSCSHSRAYQLFGEAMNSKSFVSKKCKSLGEANSQSCSGSGGTLIFNGNVQSSRTSGIYHFKTNSKSQYGVGIN